MDAKNTWDMAECVRLLSHFDTPHKHRPYARLIVALVLAYQHEIDTALTKALTMYTLSRCGLVERAVLRLSTAELLHAPEIPRNVAITEGIELTRDFCDEPAVKFVNAALDAVARGIHELQGLRASENRT